MERGLEPPGIPQFEIARQNYVYLQQRYNGLQSEENRALLEQAKKTRWDLYVSDVCCRICTRVVSSPTMCWSARVYYSWIHPSWRLSCVVCCRGFFHIAMWLYWNEAYSTWISDFRNVETIRRFLVFLVSSTSLC